MLLRNTESRFVNVSGILSGIVQDACQRGCCVSQARSSCTMRAVLLGSLYVRPMVAGRAMRRRKEKAIEFVSSLVRRSSLLQCLSFCVPHGLWCRALASILALVASPMSTAFGQQAAPNEIDQVTIRGRVVDAQGRPEVGALVRLERNNRSASVETESGAAGDFAFVSLQRGSYLITAERAGWRSSAASVVASSAGDQKAIDLVLVQHAEAHSGSAASLSNSGPPMEFSDKPNFTVAGVTDWTAVGGHGSDTTLRTSEALAREILILKPKETSAAILAGNTGEHNQTEKRLRASLAGDPGSFEANHQLGEFYLHEGRYTDAIPLLEGAHGIEPADYGNTYDLALACEAAGKYARARDEVKGLLAARDSAELHLLAAEVEEELGDPLSAVRDYERAAKEDPNEQNYFAWGSELLLHRAIWQAQEVFRRGAEAYPKSGRMLTALGAALFAGAIYDDASVSLCTASDLNPTDPEPYRFMGTVEMAAPDPLPCIEPRLKRFASEQPDNSLANYLYAMAIVKRQQQSPDPQALQRAEVLLKKATALDAKCGDAWLQLGILSSGRHDYSAAIDDYEKAIDANPQLGEAYYRLGVAYDRTGEPAKARQKFELHDRIEKAEAEAVERQRREIQQFLIIPSGQAPSPNQ